MRILLSNDDGIHAVGLRALYAAFTKAGHEVHVFAPATEQSAASSRLTLHEPLRMHSVKDGSFRGTAIAGTPADCVILGLTLMPLPDMVLSGINAGPNIGTDVFYSGTVAAALEGALHDIPALAVSCALRPNTSEDLAEVAEHAETLAASLPWPQLLGRVMNLNYPSCPHAEALKRGVQVCPLSRTAWVGAFDKRTDTRGKDYWWFSVGEDRFAHASHETNSDTVLLGSGHITLTPLHHDLTDRALVDSLHKGLGIVS